MLKSSSLFTIALAALGGLIACKQESAAQAAGKKLTLALELTQYIKQGETDTVPVTVTRSRFDGPVDIVFTNLPMGVTVSDLGGIPSSDNTRTYTLDADPTATPIKDHVVSVTARNGELSVTETFNLTVTAKN
jgi:hypothetical protein